MNAATLALSRELQGIAKNLSAAIDGAAGTHLAFTLIVYTEGRASYISNVADRQDSIREMRRLLDIWEHGMPDIPAHNVAG